MTRKHAFTEAEMEIIIRETMANLNLPQAEAERILETRQQPIKRNATLEQNWVKTLDATCSALLAGNVKPVGLVISIFWIRLYGAMTELRGHYSKSAEIAEHLSRNSQPDYYFAACAAVFSACDALVGAFSEEDLIVITFVRQVHAHLYQRGFEYGVERNRNQSSRIRDTQTIPLLRRNVGVDDAHQLVDRYVQQHGGDTKLAIAFAKKAQPMIASLAKAMRMLHLARLKDDMGTAAQASSSPKSDA